MSLLNISGYFSGMFSHHFTFSHLQSPFSTAVKKSKALQEEVVLAKNALISFAVEYKVNSPTYMLKGSHWQKDKKKSSP